MNTIWDKRIETKVVVVKLVAIEDLPEGSTFNGMGNTFVEVKKIRIKRSTHIVPFPITFKRKSYLIIKWLIEAIKEDTRKISTSEKLSSELINVLKKSSSKALQKKKLNISVANETERYSLTNIETLLKYDENNR